MRRGSALAVSLGRGGPLRERARRVLDALDVRLDATAGPLSVPGGPGTLIVANHVSWLDIVALLAVEPAAFLAKREVGDWPVLGPVAAAQGTLFVDRWALRSLPATVATVAARLREGRSVVVFPEATTWCSAPGGPFRRAAFQAALDAGAPVRPVSLEYTQGGRPSTVAAFVGDDTLVRSVGRVLRAADLTVRVRPREPLPPAGDRRQLAALARDAVLGREPARV
ncbi:1-acyl-sn-glycerol-3-phosphate acyltransferase [Prauserella shujinwangii]|uniref:1-acyl-sn-glycerol-3-phosphate acyltransferase n=1 Tax=Prauserella shujinwangii TaxID=1453103 RepID=A0A2T0LQC0_9PSEU|nr:1-acyl-sn-glycerol-3-phosphate acyltransferase [Prauserella shujinwangii]